MARLEQSHCRRFDTTRRPLATLLAAISLAAVLTGVAVGRDNEESTTVSRLIDESGRARSDGDLRLATALLRDAIKVDPNNSKAHWLLGDIKVGDVWLGIEAAQRQAAADPRQANYESRRAVLAETLDDELALARWCRKNNLEEEANVHWARVLAADPNNREALRATNMRWHDGTLMAPSDRRASRKENAAAAQSSRRWSSTVSAWTRALSDRYGSPSTKIIDEIQSVDDVAAIPAVENATLSGDLLTAPRSPAPQRLSLAFISALRDMPAEEATNSLMRYAVMSPFDDVRSAGTRKLRYRPLTDFVPTLLDGLVAPIESNFKVETGIDGSLTYRQSIYQQGALADRSYRATRSIYEPGSPFGLLANRTANDAAPGTITNDIREPIAVVSDAGVRQSARRFQNEIMTNEIQVRAANEQSAALNERIISVLANVTDQSFGNNPREWWDWWQDYTDYDRSRERPIYETREESGVMRRPERPACECFVRGTPVWTKTGRRPIETLLVGDLVLAQNVNSGEVAYKPVLLRTLRQAGPVVQIATAKEKFLSTRGHPLWVDGAGWRMAKELEEGANLHALTGAARLESVQPAANAETYNLVVADFNTYFVGTSGVLVHDNTPRRPTRCVVPGLIEKQ